MSNTTNKFSPEVRARAVRMVLDHEGDRATRWAAVSAVASKIGCLPHTLREWVNKAEVDNGKRAGAPTEVADKLDGSINRFSPQDFGDLTGCRPDSGHFS